MCCRRVPGPSPCSTSPEAQGDEALKNASKIDEEEVSPRAAKLKEEATKA